MRQPLPPPGSERLPGQLSRGLYDAGQRLFESLGNILQLTRSYHCYNMTNVGIAIINHPLLMIYHPFMVIRGWFIIDIPTLQYAHPLYLVVEIMTGDGRLPRGRIFWSPGNRWNTSVPRCSAGFRPRCRGPGWTNNHHTCILNY